MGLAEYRSGNRQHRSSFNSPMVGIEPGIFKAAATTAHLSLTCRQSRTGLEGPGWYYEFKDQEAFDEDG
ncbi:hypothetical protein EVAR_82039_1 [Eumeta japonica]|uniref:Uncharacterized protein n=1 Tax=Eumeta variegata TaxID=151549 RepID=A0A4C1XN94_EUMVA|nr:hypothetical protein EVAR_82039_1 [Eumeta japonica]